MNHDIASMVGGHQRSHRFHPATRMIDIEDQIDNDNDHTILGAKESSRKIYERASQAFLNYLAGG